MCKNKQFHTRIRRIIWGTLLWWNLSGCVPIEAPLPLSSPTPNLLTQWAVSAEASSQFGFPDWSARRATGAPEIEQCVDDARAWASARGGGLQWLQLTFARPVFATEVKIYQSFGRGAISKVAIIAVDGTVENVWTSVDETAPCPGVLAIPIARTPKRIEKLRIELDESRTGFWNQIDAIGLIGVP